MLLIAEIIVIVMLVAVLITLTLEENELKKSKIPKGNVEEYWSGQERRQSMRINAAFTVKYSVDRKHLIAQNGQMKDVSGDGMRLLVNEKFTEGTLLQLEFDLPNTKDVISAKGEVVWADGEFAERDQNGKRIFQTGIQFVNIKLNDRNRLVDYIKTIAEKT